MLKHFYNWAFFNIENQVDAWAIIHAMQPEFDNLHAGFKRKFLNMFITTISDEEGLLYWEKILDIKTNPESDTPDFRRQRILTRMLQNLPFTERMLQDVISNLMGNRWTYVLNYRDYELFALMLEANPELRKEIALTLENMIPANIQYEIIVFTITWGEAYTKYEIWGNPFNANKTWENVSEGN